MAPRSPSLTRALAIELADRRRSTGLSQEAFAAKCGIHRTYVSQLERGLKSPTVTTLERLAHILKAPPSDILRAAEKRLG